MGARRGASTASSSYSANLLDQLRSDSLVLSEDDDATAAAAATTFSSRSPAHFFASPSYYTASPWHMATPSRSPWIMQHPAPDHLASATGLVATLIRQDGHVYSLAAVGDLLYTGSDSRNIRVWKGLNEFSSFHSRSGLVKAIVVTGERVFTGHQDGKIRIWRTSSKNPSIHKRVGSLPTLAALLRSSISPSSYVQARPRRSALWLRHFDAVSCLSLDAEAGLLYSGSWDRTVKVWRVADSKCLESFRAHDDAVNAVSTGFDGLVFTGSADGTVKAWRREVAAGATRHVAVQTLLRQEGGAVTAVAVAEAAGLVYCGSSDGVVGWWQRERGNTGALARGGALQGQGSAVLCLAACRRIVASGSADGAVRVWRRVDTDGETGWAHSAVAVLFGHAGPVKCLAMEAGVSAGRYVVYSGSLDKSVKIWRVAEWERVSEAVSPRTLQRHVQERKREALWRSPLRAAGGIVNH